MANLADRLTDVYDVIGYYLRHRDEVHAYLKQREAEAEHLRAKIEAQGGKVSRELLHTSARVRTDW